MSGVISSVQVDILIRVATTNGSWPNYRSLVFIHAALLEYPKVTDVLEGFGPRIVELEYEKNVQLWYGGCQESNMSTSILNRPSSSSIIYWVTSSRLGRQGCSLII
jgi:hypothetical protein